ncbi:MCE family protein [Kutzneria chonburiensis]|uniref:MCE family protein n=1 Tax=Kutzneria chonburiensis TaxID=1483604 RepID=A0ABV6MW57_9PSEU|nr:MCE family protein [Kutzneria chonburiensis]
MKFLVFLLVSVVAATLVAVTLSGRAPDGPADDFHAIFADASNLVAGDEVRVAGIRVGTVGDLSIADSNQVRVTFSAQRTVDLTTGTHAAVKYKNLVGDRYLELTAGDGPELAPDGTIPVGQTAPALDLDALFNGFKPLLAALSPDQVNAVSGELVTVLQGEGGTIDELLAALASVTSTLADRDQVIGDVITNLDAALARVNTAELGQLIIELQQLVSGLNDDRDQIGDAVTHIDALTGRTAQLLGVVRPSLRDDIGNLGRLSNTLNANRDSLTAALATLPDAYQRLTRGAAWGGYFNIYLCGLGIKLADPIALRSGIARCRPTK